MPPININSFYLLGIAAAVLSLIWYGWQRAAAKSAAEQWLIQHHYHIRELRAPWFRFGLLTSSLHRNENNAYDFEAVVDDRDLGGTARIFLRVWGDRFGQLTGEIETSIDQIARAESEGETPLMERLADAQSEVLHRIGNGETAFYGPRRSEGGDAEFDELVEHVLALSRRGMITCDAPSVDVYNVGHYASIEKVALTPAGQSWLESQSSPQ
jgi:hypothetical protein